LHEGVVLGMAEGYAQAAGPPVLVNVHSAAGLGNAMGMLTPKAPSAGLGRQMENLLLGLPFGQAMRSYQDLDKKRGSDQNRSTAFS
jgi:hypothetical protein